LTLLIDLFPREATQCFATLAKKVQSGFAIGTPSKSRHIDIIFPELHFASRDVFGEIDFDMGEAQLTRSRDIKNPKQLGVLWMPGTNTGNRGLLSLGHLASS
jgi:hypothetical protein